MDPKKNCILINEINLNLHTSKPLSFSEWQFGNVIKRRRVHKWISVEHVDQKDNIK